MPSRRCESAGPPSHHWSRARWMLLCAELGYQFAFSQVHSLLVKVALAFQETAHQPTCSMAVCTRSLSIETAVVVLQHAHMGARRLFRGKRCYAVPECHRDQRFGARGSCQLSAA